MSAYLRGKWMKHCLPDSSKMLLPFIQEVSFFQYSPIYARGSQTLFLLCSTLLTKRMGWLTAPELPDLNPMKCLDEFIRQEIKPTSKSEFTDGIS